MAIDDVDDFWRQVAAVVGAGHGEEFEAGGDGVVDVAEVELDGHERCRARVDRFVERDGDVAPGRRRRSGDQPSSSRVSRTFSGRQSGSQESAVTCAMPSRRLRLTLSPGTGSALALKAVRTKVPWPAIGRFSGFASLSRPTSGDVRDGAVAAAAAGGVGVGMEDDADAGHWFVEFRQVHRDVVGDERGAVRDVHETRRLDVEAGAGVGGADFNESTGWSSKSLPRALSRTRCSATHCSTSASVGCASLSLSAAICSRSSALRRFAGRFWLRSRGGS